jgi:hypothetical protein
MCVSGRQRSTRLRSALVWFGRRSAPLVGVGTGFRLNFGLLGYLLRHTRRHTYVRAYHMIEEESWDGSVLFLVLLGCGGGESRHPLVFWRLAHGLCYSFFFPLLLSSSHQWGRSRAGQVLYMEINGRHPTPPTSSLPPALTCPDRVLWLSSIHQWPVAYTPRLSFTCRLLPSSITDCGQKSSFLYVK